MNNNIRVSTSNNHAGIGALAMALVVTSADATTADKASVRIVPCFFKAQNLTNCASEEGGAITNCLPLPKAATPSVTVQDVIIQSQNILGIGKLHLANIFKMSRQNLDKLIKNTEQKPTSETETRVLQVKKALEVISEICPYKLGASSMTCKINGRRLLDELSEDEINLAEVRIFSQEIVKRIKTNHQSNLPERVTKNQEFMDTFNSI
ncbi:MAG: hypothetical protein IBX55_22230 [Methyloprofundus sp.]|nr:hypothetical protein [Methyloprofundus sp.]